jgi:DNA-nicking Smr family endonuclease
MKHRLHNGTSPKPCASHDDPSLDSPFDEPVTIPIDGVLDLHSVAPKDARAVVGEYLQECYRQNIGEIRVIHGKGIGLQREMVRSVLTGLDFVQSFADAPMEAGGWGATVITLCLAPGEQESA